MNVDMLLKSGFHYVGYWRAVLTNLRLKFYPHMSRVAPSWGFGQTNFQVKTEDFNKFEKWLLCEISVRLLEHNSPSFPQKLLEFLTFSILLN